MLIWGGSVAAANYYFSTADGDDSRSFATAQDAATPWQSMAKFNEIFLQLQAGDTVFFHRGEVFDGGMVLDRSGTESLPIVIGAYGTGAKPVINGFVEAGTWTPLGNGIYESEALSTGDAVNMVVINGTNYAKGRYPNPDIGYGGYLTMNTVGGNTITSEELTGSPDWDGAQVVIRTSHWTIERFPITDHSGTTINYGGSPVYVPREGYGFFVQDHLNTLDQYGEWYYNPATKKVSVYFGSEVPDAGTAVQVTAVDVLVDTRGSNIVLDGLSLEGANQYGVVNFVTHVERLTVRNCAIKYSGIDAIFFTAMDFGVIENCAIQK